MKVEIQNLKGGTVTRFDCATIEEAKTEVEALSIKLEEPLRLYIDGKPQFLQLPCEEDDPYEDLEGLDESGTY